MFSSTLTKRSYRRCSLCGQLDCEGTHAAAPNFDSSPRRAVEPVLVCIECHIEIGGIARAGMPCPFCDGHIIDLVAHIRVLVDKKAYDPVKQLISTSERRRVA